MCGRTATWRQPVHSTFVVTVNDQLGRLPSDQDSRLRTPRALHVSCGRNTALQSAREEIVPGKGRTHQPSLRSITVKRTDTGPTYTLNRNIR
eukprot:7060187-Prymnesium_polylepis.1